MQSAAPPKCSEQWLIATRKRLRTNASPFGLGSTSVTLSPNRMTFMATGSTSARLEALSEPGGICISRVVRDQIRDKLPYPFEDKGERSVKNIARSVRVCALRP